MKGREFRVGAFFAASIALAVGFAVAPARADSPVAVASHLMDEGDFARLGFDLSGAVEDLRVFFEIGNRIADGEYYPLWSPGTEFKAKRDAMMKR